jgi:hypothetical protein
MTFLYDFNLLLVAHAGLGDSLGKAYQTILGELQFGLEAFNLNVGFGQLPDIVDALDADAMECGAKAINLALELDHSTHALGLPSLAAFHALTDWWTMVGPL